MKKSSSLTAISLRNLLAATLIIVMVLAGAGFYYAFGQIKTYAAQVEETVTRAHASIGPSASHSTKNLQDALAKQTTVIAILDKFYASPNDFQAKAIQDINTYAQKSNLAIGDVTLGDGGTVTTTPSLTPTPTLTVKLKSPVSYTSLLKFITYVQNSVPKMRIQSVSIQHAIANGDTVTVESLTIEVMTK